MMYDLQLFAWALAAVLSGMVIYKYTGEYWDAEDWDASAFNPLPAVHAAVADRLPDPPPRLRPAAHPPPVPARRTRQVLDRDFWTDDANDQPLIADQGGDFTLTPQLAAWTRRKPARPEPAGHADGWAEHVLTRLRDPDDPGAEHWLHDLGRTATP